ncbi:MAG: hypothetical protein ACREOZ_00590, partial [Gloeomargaritales cyanobacterium]
MVTSSAMCAAGALCKDPNLPVGNRHKCPDCMRPLHGMCGVEVEESMPLPYHNRCHDCASKRRVAEDSNVMVMGGNSNVFTTIRPNAAAASNVFTTIRPNAASNVIAICGNAAATSSSRGIFFKCNFRSCTNIDRNEVLHDCSNEKCGKQVHHACYIRIMEKEHLVPLTNRTSEDGRDVINYTCTKACYTKVSRMRSTNLLNSSSQKKRWDADGPNGPDIPPHSLSVLMEWWTTEGN